MFAILTLTSMVVTSMATPIWNNQESSFLYTPQTDYNRAISKQTGLLEDRITNAIDKNLELAKRLEKEAEDSEYLAKILHQGAMLIAARAIRTQNQRSDDSESSRMMTEPNNNYLMNGKPTLYENYPNNMDRFTKRDIRVRPDDTSSLLPEIQPRSRDNLDEFPVVSVPNLESMRLHQLKNIIQQIKSDEQRPVQPNSPQYFSLIDTLKQPRMTMKTDELPNDMYENSVKDVLMDPSFA